MYRYLCIQSQPSRDGRKHAVSPPHHRRGVCRRSRLSVLKVSCLLLPRSYSSSPSFPIPLPFVHFTMAAWNVGLGIALVVVFFVVMLRQCCTSQTRTRNLDAFQALNSPSVRYAENPMERRIAMAAREAAKGFVACEGCGFENAMRSTSCVLCGAASPVKVSALMRFLSGQRNVHTFITQHTSSRQHRVKKRKEWTRTIGASNAIVYHHDKQQIESSPMVFPYYVLEKTDNISSTGDKLEAPDHVSIDMESESALALPAILAGGSDDLDNDLSVVEVSSEHPISSAFRVPRYATSLVDSVTRSTLDFPTKLAEFIAAAGSLFSQATQELEAAGTHLATRFHIVRDTLLADSLHAVANLSTYQARSAIRVEFIGEKGIDAGAVYRSWMEAVNAAIVSPSAGIFVCVNAEDKSFCLNPHSREVLGEAHLVHFFATGRLLGRALMEGNRTGFYLALPLLKIILGVPVSFHDLEYYDPESYASLKWLVDNEGVETLALDFTVTEKFPSGETRTVELLPGGSSIDVTDANKLEYIDRKLKYLLFESVSSQLRAFLTGIYDVVPLELLMVFDVEELAYILSGSDDIDVDDWEAHTVATVDVKGASYDLPRPLTALACYDNFWKVVRELSPDERRRLLQFCTGSTRPPPGGFSCLTSYDGRLALFTLLGVPVDATHGNLQSHACFNRLEIPTYWSLDSMRKAIHAAISHDVDVFTID